MVKRKRVMFAGIEFSGMDYGEHGVRVPVPVLRKIIDSNKVKIVNTRLNFDDTGDNHTKGEVGPDTIHQSIATLAQGETPRICTLKSGVLRYSSHHHEAYQITEK